MHIRPAGEQREVEAGSSRVGWLRRPDQQRGDQSDRVGLLRLAVRGLFARGAQDQAQLLARSGLAYPRVSIHDLSHWPLDQTHRLGCHEED